MKEKKAWPLRECKTCKKKFEPYTSNQSHCQNPCTARTKKTLEEINAAWAMRTEEDRKRQFKSSKANFHLGQMRVI